MAGFIKLYDWTLETRLDIEERVILSLINQFSEYGGNGFFAGFSAMASRTGIPKAKCKAYTEHLVSIGAVSETKGTISKKTRIILKTNPDFVAQFSDD